MEIAQTDDNVYKLNDESSKKGNSNKVNTQQLTDTEKDFVQLVSKMIVEMTFKQVEKTTQQNDK